MAEVYPVNGITLPDRTSDAYEVYSALFAADLVPDLKSEVALIRITTQRDQIDEKGCPPSHGLSGIPKLAEDIFPSVEDYNRQNRREHILAPKFALNRPYKLIAIAELKKYFPKNKPPDWDTLFRRYPGSRGFITLSAIGFNRSRDVALVKVKVDCGVPCGSVQLYQLHKIDGRWQQAKMVGCGLVF
jgi:hypothetical protein